MNALKQYVDINKLTVNTDKTESMYISRHKGTPYPSEMFTFNNVKIRHVSKYKYVGAWIDRYGSTDVQVQVVHDKRVGRQCMLVCLKYRRYQIDALCT